MSKKAKFQLTFPENVKKDADLISTKALNYDGLGDFIQERDRVKREAQKLLDTKLRIDYSDFANHVFFDSALSKFDIAKDRIFKKFPFNGSKEEKDAYILTGSDYEEFVLSQWPRDVSYVEFNGTNQYITASDFDNKILPGSSSFYISARVDPFIEAATTRTICSHLSQSGVETWGFELFIEDSPPIQVGATIYSGSSSVNLTSSYGLFTGSFNNVAFLYDVNQGSASLYVNQNLVASALIASSITGPIEFGPSVFVVASGTLASHTMYSGSIDEVRIMHSGSQLWHEKNYNRPIDSESFVKLRYTFDEGHVGTGSIDQVVVDYSKTGLHGLYSNYSTVTSRVSGSSINGDSGEPILYDFHPRVVSFTASQELSASNYDKQNSNEITNFIPESILIDDENSDNLYKSFVFSLARFFDQIKLHIDQFDNLKSTNYSGVNDVPDLFLPTLQRYFGWKVTEHFGDANPLALFFGENVLSSGSLDTSLIEIKNQFWRRMLNNLPYLMKTKGKRHNLDAFFNILGINKDNNIHLKEYGYLPGSSIQDTRIHKQKVVSLLGIGTGSFGVLSSSFAKATGSIAAPLSSYTVETLAQLPFVSASYTQTLITGSIWQFIDPEQVTGSFSLWWELSPSLDTGKFILTGSDGQEFSSSLIQAFDGNFVHIAAGLNSSQFPFIEVRKLDNDELELTSSDVGLTALSGVFTGSKYDFVMGANSGSVFFDKESQGFYGEYRIWNRALSGSELDDHALHFESIGTSNPEISGELLGHWALNENITASLDGTIGPLVDLSRNGLDANGAELPASENPYQKFLLDYNYLSPSVDLKWSENKIRIRNKTELTIDDVATDTNEVSLEFNLVESLNEDITKILSTFDILNNLIGRPVNKYRDEYSDLEGLRRQYFERLGDSIHFTNFFKLFKWFDRKLSDSIKQLLPARVRFIGGEQVVESHTLERPRYELKYPKFRTPVTLPESTLRGTFAESKRDDDPLFEGVSSASFGLSSDPGDQPYVIDAQNEIVILGENNESTLTAKSQEQKEAARFYFNDTVNGNYLTSSKGVSTSLVTIDGQPPNQAVTLYEDGVNEKKINQDGFVPLLSFTKASGDTNVDRQSSNSSVNYRDEFAREVIMKRDKDNTG